jgi:hypothetical protein
MKYKTIGAFKSVQNVPYCKATVDLKVGMGVVIDRTAKTASLPEDGKSVVYIVTNINDKPELHNSPETYVVKAGEFVRADDLRTVNGQEIELAAFEIDGGTDDLAKDDVLVFDTTGLVKKTDDATGYAVSFKVIAKTSYMDDGILAEIVAQ